MRNMLFKVNTLRTPPVFIYVIQNYVASERLRHQLFLFIKLSLRNKYEQSRYTMLNYVANKSRTDNKLKYVHA